MNRVGIRTGEGPHQPHGEKCSREHSITIPQGCDDRHSTPGLYHEMVLARYSNGLLVHLERMVRAVARKWLHLPHDVPKVLFHLHTADGGLGLPELLVQVPLMRCARVCSTAARRTETQCWQQWWECQKGSTRSEKDKSSATLNRLQVVPPGSAPQRPLSMPQSMALVCRTPTRSQQSVDGLVVAMVSCLECPLWDACTFRQAACTRKCEL